MEELEGGSSSGEERESRRAELEPKEERYATAIFVLPITAHLLARLQRFPTAVATLLSCVQ